MASLLNTLAKSHSDREMPGLAAIEVLRKSQEISRRTPAAHNASHARLQKAEGFNRLHPGFARSTPMPVAAGASYGEPMLNPERRGAGGSSFEIGRDDPGNQGGSRFEWISVM
jgi:hypothetical protein